MPEDLESLFLRETQRRRQQKRHQQLRRVSLALTLVLFGAGLVYVLREQVLWLVVIGLSSAGLWLVWGRWGRDRWPELPWLRSLMKGRRWRRYSWGYALLFFILLYQFYPRVVTTPFQTLYARLVHQPAPPTDTPWPWSTAQQLHPAIAQLGPEQETGIRAVANYLKAQEPDPEQQVKAIHDYVISRVTYDQAVLEPGERPAQDALTVFQTRKAVCEGYARLFAAIAQAMDLDVVYLEGRVRRDLAPIDVIPTEMRLESPLYDWTLHAWNAVKVNGEWQLVDTTWDDSDAAL
jgi:transglutaminase-like putative cysteine protease